MTDQSTPTPASDPSSTPDATPPTPESTSGTGSTLAIGCIAFFVVALIVAIVAVQLFG